MLATLQPMQNEIKPPPPPEYSFKYPPSRYSPPESPRQLPSFLNGGESSMNNSHRILPPAFNLPPVDRGQSTLHGSTPLPPAPPQWSGHDDSMKNWLHAKAEEDRRKQEEERTKQETLRLDQRRIEQNMLKESLQGGIPPPMVPLIFAGMGGGNLPSHTLEWAQQYLAQLSIQNQQQQQQLQTQQQQIQQQQQQQIQHQSPPSPDMRRDTRMIPPNPYGAQQHPQQHPQPNSAPQSHSQLPNANRGLLQGPPSTSTLSRLVTAELQPQPVPSSTTSSRHSGHPLQQTQTAQSEPSAGQSLFFHHWTPPNNGTGALPPPTPSGKSQQGSPFSQPAASHLRSEYQNSPKKRKIGGNHPSGMPPTSQPLDPSPPGSSHRDHSPRPRSQERRHSRQHSEASSRETDPRPVARPSSRQQRQDELSGAQHYQS